MKRWAGFRIPWGWVALHLAIATLIVANLVGGGGGARSPGISAPPPDGAVLLTAAESRDSRLRYRVVATADGEIVYASRDHGQSWSPVLTPGDATSLAEPGSATFACRPARYSHVRALLPSWDPSAPLYIATSGTTGDYLDRGCSSSVGGLFVESAEGRVRALGVDGLPFAQDPVGRTIRAYDPDSVVIDPAQPATLYVHAGQGTAPGSPPAGLYRSVDGGQHWAPINGGLTPSEIILNSAGMAVPVYGAGILESDAYAPGHLMFRNDTGDYSSIDGGQTWQRQGDSSPAPPTPPIAATPPPTPTPGQEIPVIAQPQAIGAQWPRGWTWSRLTPQGTLPPARQDAALVWDGTDHQLLVFGGADTESRRNMGDLWAYEAGTNRWVQRSSGPDGRFGASAAWDPIDHLLLIFGGQSGAGSGATFRGDLWAYRPSTDSWWSLGANGPAPRSHALLVWDTAYNRLLLFGGETAEAPWRTTNDLWSFALAPGGASGSWTQIFAANPGCTVTCPQPRAATLGAWDSAAGLLRLFGGRNGAQSVLSDTWSWRPSGPGGTWSQENRAAQPAGRAEGAVAYDGAHGGIVVGPGLSLAAGDSNDTWRDDPTSSTWQPLPIAAIPQPPSRRLTGWVWDDASGRFLLFGGRLSGGTATSDLWQLAPGGPVPIPTAQPTATTVAGLVEGWIVDNKGDPLIGDAHIAAMAQAGARYVRMDFRLANARDWTDPHLLAQYDSAVNRFMAAGIRVLGLVTNEATHGRQADWTANNRENASGNGSNPYINVSYVQRALVPLVRHFHGRIALWELWNEPNSYQSCTGAVCTGGPFMYPSNFAALLADSYTAIKDPAPEGLGFTDVTLIAGGLLGHSIGGVLTSTNAGADYLRNTFAMGAATGTWTRFAATHGGARPLDAIGQHIYVDQTLLTTGTDVTTYYTWLRDAVPDGTLPPTFMTEGAWNTAGLPQSIQAQNLGILYRATRTMGFVPYTLWFQMQDVPPANLYFGLATAAGDRKLAWSEYQGQAG